MCMLIGLCAHLVVSKMRSASHTERGGLLVREERKRSRRLNGVLYTHYGFTHTGLQESGVFTLSVLTVGERVCVCVRKNSFDLMVSQISYQAQVTDPRACVQGLYAQWERIDTARS